MTLEVQVAASAEQLGTQEPVQHAHDLAALVVNRRRVEVRDLDVRVRPDRMSQGTRVLGKLHGPQKDHILDPLHGSGLHVRSELRIAVDGKPLLEAQLKPVAAGDPIARPVVEVLVGNDGFDALIGRIGRGIRSRQNGRGIEDVEALVFHGAHVEIFDRHDHEDVQIVLPTELLLVPGHGAF